MPLIELSSSSEEDVSYSRKTSTFEKPSTSSQGSYHSSQNKVDSPQSMSAKLAAINESLESLGLSKLSAKYTIKERKSYILRKAELDRQRLVEIYSDVLLPKGTRLSQAEMHFNEADQLVDEVEKQLPLCQTRAEKVVFLTVLPLSMTIGDLSKRLGKSPYTIRQARNLRNRGGLLYRLPPKKGRSLDESILSRVKDFFERDDISWCSPSASECVRASQDNFLPCRKLMYTLREAYLLFKKECDVKIGYSSFAKLIPINVKLLSVGQKTCICIICQNFKMLLGCITPESVDEVLMFGCCIDYSESCAQLSCNKCDYTAFSVSLRAQIEGCEEELVSYWCWVVSTKRCELVERKEKLGALVDDVAKKIDRLRAHIYIRDVQKAFRKEKVDHIGMGECLLFADFAENNNFWVQDEVSPHYFNRGQCTLFTLVAV